MLNVYPKVDIILPFHKVDDLLKNAIESVLASEEIKVRLILIDDRPLVETHQTPFVLPENISSLKFEYEIFFSNSIGYAAAVNMGLDHAQSHFIAIMNSDDLIDSKAIIKKLALLEGNDLVIGEIVKFNDNYCGVPSLAGRIPPSSFRNYHLLLGSYGANSTWVMSLELASKFRLDTSYESADWATALKNFRNFKISGSDDSYYFYRQHSSQVTRSKVYRTRSFPAIFPLWCELNTFYELPWVSYRIASSIAAPFMQTRLNHKEFLEMKSWCDAFLKLENEESITSFNRNLLNRRMVFARPFAFQNIKLFKTYFTIFLELFIVPRFYDRQRCHMQDSSNCP